jgi:alpha-ketoglutarate-dependent taurine dioxygenase
MTTESHPKPALPHVDWLRRRPLRPATDLDPGEAIEEERDDAEPALPLVVRAARPSLPIAPWVARHRSYLGERLGRHGAVLLRGFEVGGAVELQATVRALGAEPMAYVERSSPRRNLGGHIYSSTEYPPDQEIFFHNENAYAAKFPAKLFFLCQVPAPVGGETPLADCRRVLASLRPDLIDRFARAGVLYVRTFSAGLGLDYRTVFGASAPDDVERIAREAGYDVEWLAPERLQTRRVGPAVIAHPVSGELCWFNHAAFFHASTLPAAVAQGLIEELGENQLPNQTYYGNGEPIAPETLTSVRAAYLAASARFRWMAQDLLIIDNLLVAHGRTAFSGPRSIAVALAEPLEAVRGDRSHLGRALDVR